MKIDRELLSVIIPVYNTEKYLEKCIQSLLFQEYQNLEIILVDDGSTDKSAVICDEYSERDGRIKVIHSVNEGPVSARYKGLQEAKGKYVTFADSDDWIERDMYSRLMSIMTEKNVQIVVSGIIRYYSEAKRVYDCPLFPEGYYNRERICNEVIPDMLWSPAVNGWKLDPSLWSKIFRKECIEPYMKKIQYYSFHYGDDTAVIFPMLLNTDSMYITSECFYYHRQRGEDEVAPYFSNSNYFEKTFKVYSYLKEEFGKSSFFSVLEKQLDCFYINSVNIKKKCYSYLEDEICPVLPFYCVKPGSKVILYGAGNYGREYFEQNLKYHFCQIVLWVDKRYKKINGDGNSKVQIVSPDEMEKVDFDNVIIAVDSGGLASQIAEQLIEKGIEPEKIIWRKTFANKLIWKNEKEETK